MIRRLRSFFEIQLRVLQIRLETWKKAREISRAYHGTGTIRLPAGTARLIVGVVVAACLVAAALFVLPRAAGGIHGLKVAVKKLAARSAPLPRPNGKRAVRPGVQVVAADTSKADSALELDTLRLPDSLMSTAAAKLWTPTASMRFVLLANKATSRLYLLVDQKGVWRVGRVYEVVTGRNSGQKSVEGDRRTPEGTYVIIGKREKNELDVIYGPLAYTLNYPNDRDRIEGRTGQGIWLHGTAPDSALAPSRGCIKMANDDLQGLAAILQNGIGTPVVIINDSVLTDPVARVNIEALRRERRIVLHRLWSENLAFAAVLEEWRRSWEARDINRFSTCYLPDAQSGGQGFRSFIDQKSRTFLNYRTISIGIDSVLVSDVTDSVAVVKFVQHYASNVSQMINAKKLVFRNRSGAWKIYQELTFPKEELFL